jgi:hypothetical protein
VSEQMTGIRFDVDVDAMGRAAAASARTTETLAQ